ncbi:hypothetical protein Tco_0869689, partial [Tanacetum coccineum]
LLESLKKRDKRFKEDESFGNIRSRKISLICIGRGSGRCIVDTNAEAVARVEAKWKRDFDRKSVTCIIEGDHDNEYISTFAVIVYMEHKAGVSISSGNNSPGLFT